MNATGQTGNPSPPTSPRPNLLEVRATCRIYGVAQVAVDTLRISSAKMGSARAAMLHDGDP